uniref:Metallophosphatase family protein n=1 Tax=candidate division WOR-3 bacterium TaxID=2052148 RepID=A0A7C2K4M0_UNCW3
MWLFLLSLFLDLPPWYAKPSFSFHGDTLIISVCTQNPSSGVKLTYGRIKDPLDFNFENYKISRIVDTLHTFNITDVDTNFQYAFKVAFFDTLNKIYYATQTYYFKPKKVGQEFREGLTFDVWPYLSMTDSNSVGISFYTNRPCRTRLYINGQETLIDSSKKIKHELVLKNVKPGKYEYYIEIFDDVDTTVSFTFNFSIPKKNWKIGIFGDTRGNPSNINPAFFVDGVNEQITREIMRLLYEESVNVVFVLGDLITGRMKSAYYAEEEYKSFLKACWPYSSFLPIMPVPGNHDMIAPVMEDEEKRYNPPPPNSAENLWAKVFVLPENGPQEDTGMPPYKENVYFINLGDIAIYALNSDYNYILYKNKPNPAIRLPDQNQRIWLKIVRDKNKGKRHHIVMFHEPLIGLSAYGRGGRSPEVDSFANFLKSLNFKFYLSGHDHLYARCTIFNGLIQIVTAGGGAPLYDLNEKQLEASNSILHNWAKTFHYLIVEKNKRNNLKITAKNLNKAVIDSLILK